MPGEETKQLRRVQSHATAVFTDRAPRMGDGSVFVFLPLSQSKPEPMVPGFRALRACTLRLNSMMLGSGKDEAAAVGARHQPLPLPAAAPAGHPAGVDPLVCLPALRRLRPVAPPQARTPSSAPQEAENVKQPVHAGLKRMRSSNNKKKKKKNHTKKYPGLVWIQRCACLHYSACALSPPHRHAALCPREILSLRLYSSSHSWAGDCNDLKP